MKFENDFIRIEIEKKELTAIASCKMEETPSLCSYGGGVDSSDIEWRFIWALS